MCFGDKEEKPLPDPAVVGISKALCIFYQKKILPLEKHHDYENFDGPYIQDAEFFAKPTVLFIGQYSVGKTTMIRYLVGEDIPGARIGPEPTTDSFTFIMHNESRRTLPGLSLMSDTQFPFKGLSKFGGPFLNKCTAATCPSPILKQISFIDTPGILAGEKQSVSRGYDFEQVVSYLAEKVDLIFLLFDAHKLDISDELKRAILAIVGNEEKVRIVLNKVDSLEPHALQRVNGALMWALSKVLKCPEVPKVYVGSYWDKPLKHPEYRQLFKQDTKTLFDDLRSLPRSVDVRRINDVAKRAKQLKIFSYVMDELIRSVGFGICTSRKAVISELHNIVYPKVCLKYRLQLEDLPSHADLQKRLLDSDYQLWRPLNKKTKQLMSKVDEFLKKDVDQFLKALPADSRVPLLSQHGPLGTEDRMQAGEVEKELQWDEVVANAEQKKLHQKFLQFRMKNNTVHTSEMTAHLIKSKLPQAVLGEIVKLVDLDGDNRINEQEFFLLDFLMEWKVSGKELPAQLPAALLPPSEEGDKAKGTSREVSPSSRSATPSSAIVKTATKTAASISKTTSS